MSFFATAASATKIIPVGIVKTTPEVYTVWNEGIGGNNTSDVLNRMSSVLANNGNLHIIMLGTNDWRHPTPSKRRTPAQFKTNLKNIISQIKGTGSDVILMSFPPIDEGDQTFDNISATDYLTAIDEIIIEDAVYFVDQWQAFVNIGQPTSLESSYMQNFANVGHTDGVHPQPIGADFIAENVITYMSDNALTTYDKIVCLGDSITRGDGLTGAGTVTGETYPARLKAKYDLI